MSETERIAGLWYFAGPEVHNDRRGAMWAWFDANEVTRRTGLGFRPHEGTIAVSGPGVIRGIHFAPGRAKFVTCISGAIWDVGVDLRRGSPTFGDWHAERLTGWNRRAVCLAAGLGHAYLSLTESTVAYLYDAPYDPGRYAAINPLDPALAIGWPCSDPVLSDKDRAAPGLVQAPWLPAYEGE